MNIMRLLEIAKSRFPPLTHFIAHKTKRNKMKWQCMWSRDAQYFRKLFSSMMKMIEENC